MDAIRTARVVRVIQSKKVHVPVFEARIGKGRSNLSRHLHCAGCNHQFATQKDFDAHAAGGSCWTSTRRAEEFQGEDAE